MIIILLLVQQGPFRRLLRVLIILSCPRQIARPSWGRNWRHCEHSQIKLLADRSSKLPVDFNQTRDILITRRHLILTATKLISCIVYCISSYFMLFYFISCYFMLFYFISALCFIGWILFFPCCAVGFLMREPPESTDDLDTDPCWPGALLGNHNGATSRAL